MQLISVEKKKPFTVCYYESAERKNMKKYKKGMFGGKFIPFHKGHIFCLDRAAAECETVYLLLFVNGDAELEILKGTQEKFLLPDSRIEVIGSIAEKCYGNVVFKVIDVMDVKLPDGSEDWDGETPLVYAACGGEPDAVYGSEESYLPYFHRAYPHAECILVDPARVNVPISATMIRAMKEWEERYKWLAL